MNVVVLIAGGVGFLILLAVLTTLLVEGWHDLEQGDDQ